jgi:hypothetical protein
MDEAQVLALLQQALAGAGVTDLTVIRRAALELAVAHISPPPAFVPVDMATIAQRTRAAWGLDYATILNNAAVTYADTTLTAPEVLTEIANTLTV